MYTVAFQPFLHIHLRKHETAELPYFDTTRCTIIKHTCNRDKHCSTCIVHTKIAILLIVVALIPGEEGHISAVVWAIDSKFATTVHRTMHKQYTVLTRKKYSPNFATFSRGRSQISAPTE